MAAARIMLDAIAVSRISRHLGPLHARVCPLLSGSALRPHMYTSCTRRSIAWFPWAAFYHPADVAKAEDGRGPPTWPGSKRILKDAMLEHVFHEGDLDQDGTLDLEEFILLVKELGLNWGHAHTEEVFASMDANADGRVTNREWQTMLLDGSRNSRTEDEQEFRDKMRAHMMRKLLKDAVLEHVFHEGDLDRDGTLNLEEFIILVQELGLNWDRAHTGEVFASMDANADGHVTDPEWQTRLLHDSRNSRTEDEQEFQDKMRAYLMRKR